MRNRISDPVLKCSAQAAASAASNQMRTMGNGWFDKSELLRKKSQPCPRNDYNGWFDESELVEKEIPTTSTRYI